MTSSTIIHKRSTTVKLALGSYVPETPCPACKATNRVRYSLIGHRVTCMACGWAVQLAPQEHVDFSFALCCPGRLDLGLFLAVIHTRCAPPAEEPPRLHGQRGPDGSFKLVVPPLGEETVLERLHRLADQAEVNGVILAFGGRCITATSQRRDPTTGRPVAEYQLCPDGAGGWRCSCQAEAHCAHLALYWRHLHRLLNDPDATAATGQTIRRTIWRIEGQAPESDAQVRERARRAADELFGTA